MDRNKIVVRNLTKIYNGKKVLDIPFLFLQRGMIYGVTGPNGSGKTTLLSILSLLTWPTSGTIHIDGREMRSNKHNETALRRQMTIVLQNPFLLNTTVEKNVAYGLKIRGLSNKEQKQKVEESLKLVGLTGFEKRKACELSGGEVQRVAFARGIAVNPKVLFIDEPTANVDKAHIGVLERVIKGLSRNQKTTVVFTTHDSRQAHRLADEVVFLFEGKVKETQGKSRDVTRQDPSAHLNLVSKNGSCTC